MKNSATSLLLNFPCLHFPIYILVAFLLVGCTAVENEEEPDDSNVESIHVGNVLLTTQAEVEEFGANNYTAINGSLTIGLDNYCAIPNTYAVNDLSPLSSLQKIFNGRLYIEGGDYDSFYGLHNLESVGSMRLGNLPNIVDFTSFESLTNIGGAEEPYVSLSVTYCDRITSFAGFEGVTFSDLNVLFVWANKDLESLDGLENIPYVEAISIIQGSCGTSSSGGVPFGHENLTNFCGIANMIINGNFQRMDIHGNAYNPTVADFINGDCSL